MSKINRRQFVQFITSQGLAYSLAPTLLTSLSGCVSGSDSIQEVNGIRPTFEDDLILADGLSYEILASWGDRLNPSNEVFGFNNDFTSFLPIKGREGEAFLWVNHESVSPEFVHGKSREKLTRSPSEIIKEQELVGGTILHIKKSDSSWKVVSNSKLNRRVHGRTQIPFSDNHKILGHSKATGTLANCAGGQTPWGTFLSCEENYDDFYGEARLINGKRQVTYKNKFNWYKQFPLPPEHYGWVVEIDPKTGQAEKQITLGRAPHEGATVAVSPEQKVAVYMGEDRPGGFIYKFISYEGTNFNKGRLYAADTKKGRWLALDIDENPKLKKLFRNQLEVLTYCHQAAEAVGATPQDRPEGIDIRPGSKDVFISLTKNPDNNNHFGSLLKISEAEDFHSLTFEASTWLSGGPQAGLACPDNIIFDRKGNLWVTVDIAEKAIGNSTYKRFGNNGLFYIPMSGPQAGQAIQVASAPNEAELTGPSFSSDYKTLFLSVQHPGSLTRDNLNKPTSQWALSANNLPRPSVVTIQGPLLDRLMT